MKYVFAILIIAHGFFHLIGFAKAFHLAQIEALPKEISRPMGILWLVGCLLLVAAAILYLLSPVYWWIATLVAVVWSQALIVMFWSDTRYGTIINAFVLLVTIIGWVSWRYEQVFQNEVSATRAKMQPSDNTLLTSEMLSGMPAPVQRYIIYTGAVGKPLVRSWAIDFEGQIRKDEKAAWMPFETRQYNFIDPPARLFFMNATMFGLPVAGYHRFANGNAMMDIRLLSLWKVQYVEGPEMNQSETVTWFNDLCLYAPGALIDKRIAWETINDTQVKATFSSGRTVISATLFFNDKGELINFLSDDRYYHEGKGIMRKVRFSTPARNYAEWHGHRLPGYGEAVWNFEDHDLVYGQFTLKDIRYNAN